MTVTLRSDPLGTDPPSPYVQDHVVVANDVPFAASVWPSDDLDDRTDKPASSKRQKWWPGVPRWIKEYSYLRKREPAPSHAVVSWTTAWKDAANLWKLVRWLRLRNVHTLAEFTREHMEAYIREKRKAGLKDASITVELMPLALLPAYGKKMSDRLTFVPFAGTSVAREIGWYRDTDQNITPPLPDTVYRGVLIPALAIVENSSPDDVAASHGIGLSATALPENDFSGCVIVKEYLENGVLVREVTAHERPEACCPPVSMNKHYTRSTQLVDAPENGVPTRVHLTYTSFRCPTCSNTHRDTGLWPEHPQSRYTASARKYIAERRSKFITVPSIAKEMGANSDTMVQYLKAYEEVEFGSSDRSRKLYSTMTACYIVIMALSGMRDAEAKGLKVGCVDDDPVERGPIRYYRVYGKRAKQGGPTAKKKAMKYWVVTEPVVRAIRLLEAIQTALGGEDGHPLFLKPRSNNKTSLTSEESADLVRLFYEANRTSTGAPEYHISPMQFRRTLARQIARQPFGAIAGKLQYGHVKTGTFMGYCNYDSEWQQDISDEEALYRAEVFEEFERDIEAGRVAGAGVHRLVEFRGQAGDRRPDDVAHMLKHPSRNLHVGAYSYCFFNPDHALCRKSDAVKDRDRPILSFCQPGACKNSCIGSRHIPRWQEQVDDAKNMLKTRGITEGQKVALEKDIREIEELIRPIMDNLGDDHDAD